MQTFEHPNPPEVKVLDELMLRLSHKSLSSLCPLIKELPLVYRLTHLEVSQIQGGHYSVTAEIYHDSASTASAMAGQPCRSAADSRCARSHTLER